jgi:hypothetical protein
MKALCVSAALVLFSSAVFGLDAKAGGAASKAQAPGPIVTETDSDGDGSVDFRVYFLKTGQKEHEEFDYNKDSTMDDFLYYNEGIAIREEIDSNFDGRIDIWVYLLEGKYIRRYERDLDGDGKPDVVKDYDQK